MTELVFPPILSTTSESLPFPHWAVRLLRVLPTTWPRCVSHQPQTRHHSDPLLLFHLHDALHLLPFPSSLSSRSSSSHPADVPPLRVLLHLPRCLFRCLFNWSCPSNTCPLPRTKPTLPLPVLTSTRPPVRRCFSSVSSSSVKRTFSPCSVPFPFLLASTADNSRNSATKHCILFH